ncbi:MAG: rhodanese-like domain-containing protein [Candidatus Diapherotrites archaeon]|nr:rhodanese-like domain-containing protein [Candidatus Diapherotrites archaeon]
MSGTIELDPRVKQISVAELKKKLDAKEDLLLADVNPRDRFEKHHIKGAVFVEWEKAGRWFVENNVPKNKQIVLYCENTMCTASPIVSNKLVKLGYKNVFEFSDGVQGWIKAGGEWEGSG